MSTPIKPINQANIEAAITDKPGFLEEIGAGGTPPLYRTTPPVDGVVESIRSIGLNLLTSTNDGIGNCPTLYRSNTDVGGYPAYYSIGYNPDAAQPQGWSVTRNGTGWIVVSKSGGVTGYSSQSTTNVATPNLATFPAPSIGSGTPSFTLTSAVTGTDVEDGRIVRVSTTLGMGPYTEYLTRNTSGPATIKFELLRTGPNSIPPTSSSNIPERLVVENPYGDYANAHCGVIELPDSLPNGFGGYRYLMAYTPFTVITGNITETETPCIVGSNDKINWEAPKGCPNPLATYEEATALGFDTWSDADLVFDPTTGTLYCYWRGTISGTPSQEALYYRGTTDLVNWTPKAVIFGGLAHTRVISPSVVREKDGTWSMFCTDKVGGYISRRTSASPMSGYSAPVACTSPAGMSAHHSTVRRHYDMYYCLVASGDTSHDNTYRNFMLYSKDGLTWEGSHKLFIPVSGLRWDRSNYRCAFLPKGWPTRFDVWSVQSETLAGDDNDYYINYSEVEWDWTETENYILTRGMREMKVEDFFLTGPGGVGDNLSVGTMGWLSHNTAANGTVSYGAYSTAVKGIGGGRIITASSANAATALIQQRTGTGWPMAAFVQKVNPVWTWHLVPVTSGTGAGYYIGWGQNTSFAGTPNWFVGFRCIVGTDTNWKFIIANNGVIDLGVTDLGQAFAANSPTRLQMSWDARTSSWKARVGNRPWTLIPNTGMLGAVPVNPAIPLSSYGWLNINVRSTSAPAATRIDLDSFCWESIINHY